MNLFSYYAVIKNRRNKNQSFHIRSFPQHSEFISSGNLLKRIIRLQIQIAHSYSVMRSPPYKILRQKLSDVGPLITTPENKTTMQVKTSTHTIFLAPNTAAPCKLWSLLVLVLLLIFGSLTGGDRQDKLHCI